MSIKFINTPTPIGNFVNLRIAGSLVYLSGQGAFDDEGNLITGKVGVDLNIEQAYDAARRVGITLLSVLNNEIGLDRINKIVKISRMVNCTKDFMEQPKVINGCSDLFVDYFGKKGVHARSAIGVYMLPNNIPVEIEAIIELINK